MQGGRRPRRTARAGRRRRLTLVTAGRVGKPHGLDGSFYVDGPRHALPEGAERDGRRPRRTRSTRRAGTDERPLIRLAGVDDPRAAARRAAAGRGRARPRTSGSRPTWSAAACPASGTVAQVIDAPSCAVLELEDGDADPARLRRDRARGPRGRRDRGEPGVPRMRIDVFTLFPHWFDWFSDAAPRDERARARARARRSSTCARPRRSRRARWTTRPTAAAPGMVIRVDVVEAALEARYGAAPPPHRTIALVAGRAPVRRRARRRAGRRAGAHAALRPLRGLRRARARAPRHRRGLDRPVRAGGRRAGGDGGVRRGDPQAARARSGTRRARSRSRSARRSRARPSTRTTRARSTGAATRCPTCSCPGDHARIREWRLEQSRARAPPRTPA